MSVCHSGSLKAKNEISIWNCGSFMPKGVEFLNSNQVDHSIDPEVPAK
jgi:hypothetical protein